LHNWSTDCVRRKKIGQCNFSHLRLFSRAVQNIKFHQDKAAMVAARRPTPTIKNISRPVSTTAECARKPSQSQSSVTPCPPRSTPSRYSKVAVHNKTYLPESESEVMMPWLLDHYCTYSHGFQLKTVKFKLSCNQIRGKNIYIRAQNDKKKDMKMTVISIAKLW